jgi:hypothetical protein
VFDAADGGKEFVLEKLSIAGARALWRSRAPAASEFLAAKIALLAPAADGCKAQGVPDVDPLNASRADIRVASGRSSA